MPSKTKTKTKKKTVPQKPSYKSKFIGFQLFDSSVICLNAQDMGKTEILKDIYQCIHDNWPAKETIFTESTAKLLGDWLDNNGHGDYDDHRLACCGATGYLDSVNNDLVFMLIWPNCANPLRIVAHESVHAANRILEGLGITMPKTSDDDELQAITVDYIYMQAEELF